MIGTYLLGAKLKSNVQVFKYLVYYYILLFWYTYTRCISIQDNVNIEYYIIVTLLTVFHSRNIYYVIILISRIMHVIKLRIQVS